MPRIDHIADLVTAGRVALLLEKENVRLHARLDAMSLAIRHIRAMGMTPARIGIEAGFLPWDAGSACPRG